MAVAQSLSGGEAVETVYTPDEAGLLAAWQAFRIHGVLRIFLPTIYFVLLYGTWAQMRSDQARDCGIRSSVPIFWI
ncbi:MAG: hypothetical protein U0X20_00055 [Caldilineaceae bacterium]